MGWGNQGGLTHGPGWRVLARCRLPLLLVVLGLTALCGPSTAAAANVQLSGHVRTTLLAPVPDTLVEVLAGDGSVLASGTAGLDGSYTVTVAAGTYDVRFTPPALSGYGVLLVRAKSLVADSTLDVQVVGGSSVAVSGVVRGATNGGLPNVQVSLNDPVSGVALASTITAANGSYTLTVNSGTYELRLQSNYNTTPGAPTGQWYRGTRIALTSSLVQDLYAAPIAVQITTVGPSNNPVPGTTIRSSGSSLNGTVPLFPGDTSQYSYASWSQSTVTTDANGKGTLYIFPSTNGTPTTTVTPPDGSGLATMTANLGGLTTDVSKTIALSAGVVLSGVVRGATNGGLPNVQVSLNDPVSGVALASTITAANGSYTLTVNSGTYELRLQSNYNTTPGAPTGQWYRGTRIALTSSLVQDLYAAPIAVQITTVGPSNNPVPGTTIRSSGSSLNGTVPLFPGDTSQYSYASWSQSTVTTDANGKGTLYIFPSTNGTPTTTVTPPDGSGLATMTANLGGLTTDVSKTIALSAGVVLSGVVRGATNGGLPNVQVSLNDPVSGVALASTITAANGSYTLTVNSGTYELRLQSNYNTTPGAPTGQWYRGTRIALTSSLVQDLYAAPIAVQITTVGPSNNPVPGTTIRSSGSSLNGTVPLFPGDTSQYSYASWSQSTVTTDANGKGTLYIFPSTNGTPTTTVTPPVATTLPNTTINLSGITQPQSLLVSFQQSAADGAPPAFTCSNAPSSWSATDVVRSCTAADPSGGTGLANPADASFSLSTSVPGGTETADAPTSTKTVCDLADNCATAGPLGGNKVDKKAPTVTFQTPANGASVTKGASLTLAFQCNDGGSGVATCNGTPANGATLDTATLGQHQISVTTTDNVGNSATQTATYTVTAPVDVTGPQVTCDPAPATWSATDVTRNCTATDAGSGLANPADATFSLSTSVSAGTETANAQTGSKVVCDVALNCTTAGPLGGNKVDRLAPTVTFQTPANGANVVRNTSATLAFQCADGGSGVATCTGTPANGTAVDTSTLGPHQLSVAVTDQLGNSATRTATYTVVASSDTTPPQVSCAAAPSSWSTTDVTRACTATDGAGIGLANAGDASFSLSTAVPNGSESSNAQTNSKQVCDLADNCTTAGPLGGNKVDRKAPTVTFQTPANGANVVRNTSVTLAFQCADGGSGVATCTGTPANGTAIDTSTLGPHQLAVAVTDQLGNAATRTATYNVVASSDTTPPQVSCAAAPGTWSTTDVTRACTATDGAGIGLANAGDASFSLSTSVPNGSESSNAQTYSKQVCDLADNCTTAGPLGGNKVDKKAPTVTFQAPADGATLARYAAVTVAFQCADGGSGVGTCSGLPANGSTLDTSTPGPHQISVSVSDELGNSATRTANYTVSAGSDVTKPQISCDAAPAAWSTSNVTRTCTASDSESGLANAGDASFTLATNVPAGSESSNAQTATKQVCDADGNCATAGPLGGNKVDRKAPEVTFQTPTNGASIIPGTALTLTFQCTDAGSGVATCSGTPANGSTLDTTTLGPHEISVAVTDNLGNTATRTGAYVVQDPPPSGGGSGDGTYEINSPASGTSGISASSSLPPGSELPVPGESTSAAGGGGIVYVYLTSNGKTKPVRLTTSSSTVISNGARVNATGGTVVIIVATSTPGVFTTAEVSGGEFTVEVKPNGVTILRLSAVLDGCPNFGTQKASTKKKKTKKTKTKKKKTTKRKASTAGKKNTPKKQGRRSRTLRVSDDGGKIETWGRYAVGAPAGTTWTTTDTCDSTTIKVIEGRVRVTPLQGDPVSIVPAPKSRTVRAK